MESFTGEHGRRLPAECEQDLSGFLKRAGVTLPEAWVGVDSQPVKAYGATAIPATFLIGPDGRILARDLRGEDLRKAVDAQLSTQGKLK